MRAMKDVYKYEYIIFCLEVRREEIEILKSE